VGSCARAWGEDLAWSTAEATLQPRSPAWRRGGSGGKQANAQGELRRYLESCVCTEPWLLGCVCVCGHLCGQACSDRFWTVSGGIGGHLGRIQVDRCNTLKHGLPQAAFQECAAVDCPPLLESHGPRLPSTPTLHQDCLAQRPAAPRLSGSKTGSIKLVWPKDWQRQDCLAQRLAACMSCVWRTEWGACVERLHCSNALDASLLADPSKATSPAKLLTAPSDCRRCGWVA